MVNTDDYLDSIWYAVFQHQMNSRPFPMDEDQTEFTFHQRVEEKPDVIELVEGADGVWEAPPPPESPEARAARMQAHYRYGLLMHPPTTSLSVLNISI